MRRELNLEQGYWLARFPMTVAQWREYGKRAGLGPSRSEKEGLTANEPVGDVDWNEATAMCATYPWRGEDGPDLRNGDGSGVDRPSAVGCFAGRSVLRCAYRGWNHVGDRNGGLGFRVVVSPFTSEL